MKWPWSQPNYQPYDHVEQLEKLMAMVKAEPKVEATIFQPVAKEKDMSVKTILSDVVKGFEKVFSVGVDVAKAEEPLVDTLFPGVAGIFNTVVAECATVEAAAASAGKQTGSGASKLATVVANVTPSVVATAVANGMQAPTAAEIATIASGIVNVLNVFKPAS